MSEVSMTGDRLGIVVACKPSLSDNWMAFACWYSIHKNLPDAKVMLGYDRTQAKADMFAWAYKYKVTVMTYSPPDPGPVLPKTTFKNVDSVKIVPSWTVAARIYDPALVGPVDAKSDESATFVSYELGCGRFITSEWINRVAAPFNDAVQKFSTMEMTANERRVLELWEKADSLYKSL